MKSKRGQQIPVQRPMIFDVLPPGVAPRLDIVPRNRFRRVLSRIPHSLRHWWVGAAFSILLASGILLVWRPWQSRVATLPKDIASQISDFTPYFFTGKLPQGFTLSTKNISYSSGVLFLEVRNPSGDTVVVSEQLLPTEFSHDKPQGDQNVAGVQGVGAISSRDNRIVGTLFTNKSPRALVTLSANDTILPGTIKDLMIALKPINQ